MLNQSIINFSSFDLIVGRLGRFGPLTLKKFDQKLAKLNRKKSHQFSSRLHGHC
jgi:hypothetical protein